MSTAPRIDPARCSGCGCCVSVCPEKRISLEAAGYRKTAVIVHGLLCTTCCLCSEACPLNII